MKKDTEKNRPILLGCQEELEETGESQPTSQRPLLEDGFCHYPVQWPHHPLPDHHRPD